MINAKELKEILEKLEKTEGVKLEEIKVYIGDGYVEEEANEVIYSGRIMKIWS